MSRDLINEDAGGALVEANVNGPTPGVTRYRCIYCNLKVAVPTERDDDAVEWCPRGCEYK